MSNPNPFPYPTDLPPEPQFAEIPTFSFFETEFQNLQDELEQMLQNHKVGEALNDIITKLMPMIQSYNMEYTQGSLANGENAATYALEVTNYVSDKFSDYNNPNDTTAEDAYDAVVAESLLQQSVADAQAGFYGENPYGSMGSAVLEQLLVATDNIAVPSQDCTPLMTYWQQAWDMTSSKTSSTGLDTNSPIMQAIQAAQNQTQSSAAYLQTEAKMANENYQQYASSSHDIAQNIVDVEKQATQAQQE